MTVLVYGSLPDVRAGERGEHVRPETGYHFSGLVDGEGCFFISGQGRPSFVIKMRDDDKPLLESLRKEFGGIGRISGCHDARGRRHPQVRWDVAGRRELVWLTELFDVFPLRSKKARDYAIWREAVIRLGGGAAPADLVPYARELRRVRLHPAEAAA